VASDAWSRPATERAQFTLDECAGDATLRAEVLSLLESMEQAGERFETPALAMPASRLAATDALHASVIDPGERVGPWTVVRLLGSGGMGTVYLAERVGDEFRQRAALKIVRGPADAILLRRFQDERRILATLDHPHIARLIDGGASERGLPYVAMEYVDGLPMDVYCQEHRLDIRQRLEVFRLACGICWRVAPRTPGLRCSPSAVDSLPLQRNTFQLPASSFEPESRRHPIDVALHGARIDPEAIR